MIRIVIYFLEMGLCSEQSRDTEGSFQTYGSFSSKFMFACERVNELITLSVILGFIHAKSFTVKKNLSPVLKADTSACKMFLLRLNIKS